MECWGIGNLDKWENAFYAKYPLFAWEMDFEFRNEWSFHCFLQEWLSSREVPNRSVLVRRISRFLKSEFQVESWKFNLRERKEQNFTVFSGSPLRSSESNFHHLGLRRSSIHSSIDLYWGILLNQFIYWFIQLIHRFIYLLIFIHRSSELIEWIEWIDWLKR